MGSRLPDSVRGTNTRGRLSLYQTFMQPERSFGHQQQRPGHGQPLNLANGDQDYGMY